MVCFWKQLNCSIPPVLLLSLFFMAFVSCSGKSGEDNSQERPPSPRLVPLSFNELVEEFNSSTASNYSLSGKCDSSLGENVEVSISGTDITESATCNNDNTFTVVLDGSSLTIPTITFQATYGDKTVSSNSIANNRIVLFQSIDSGHQHTCALTTNGNVKCWGFGENGELGNKEVNNISTPVDVHTSSSDDIPLGGIAAISVGYSHTCALTTDGNVKCWGVGEDYGQLGNGATTNSSTPVDVHTSLADTNPLGGIAAISSGGWHTCALTTSGGVKCWGWGELFEQLGNGATADSSTPVDVHTSLADTNPLGGIAAISTGTYHTCVLTTNENVKCWGSGASGKLGNRKEENSSTPVDVHTSSADNSPLGDITAISAGAFHTCALTTTGNVKCWGYQEDYGELGNGEYDNSSTPVNVHTSSSEGTPLGGIAAISSGNSYACTLTTDGNVKCWGSGEFGQLGNGEYDVSIETPVNVHTSLEDANPLGGIAAISSGGFHTCALTTSGGVKCWGSGKFGQLGNGEYDNSSTSPVDILLP